MALAIKPIFNRTTNLFELKNSTDYTNGLDFPLLDPSLPVKGGLKVYFDGNLVFQNDDYVNPPFQTTFTGNNPALPVFVVLVDVPIVVDCDDNPIAGEYEFVITEQYTDTNVALQVVNYAELKFDYTPVIFPEENLTSSVSCLIPFIQVDDETDYTIDTVIPVISSPSLTLSYPPTADPSQPDLIVTNTPLSINTDNVWTTVFGEFYEPIYTLTAQYDYIDYFEKNVFNGTTSFAVSCDDLCVLLPCINELKAQVDAAECKSNRLYRDLQAKYEQVMALAEHVDIILACDDNEDISALITEIRAILDCDDLADSKKVLGEGGSIISNLNVTDTFITVNGVEDIVIGDNLTLTQTASNTILLEAAGLEEEVVDSVAEMRLLTSGSIGDEVTLRGYYEGSQLGGGNFEIVEDTLQKYLNFDAASAEGARITGLSQTLLITDEITIKFRITSLPVSRHIFTTNGATQARIQLSTAPTDGDFSFAGGIYTTLVSVIDERGRSISGTRMFFGNWYELTVTPQTGGVISGYDVATMFGQSIDVDVEFFKIAGETFELQEGSGIIITSDMATAGDLDNTPTWRTRAFDNGFDFIEAGSLLLKRIIPENTVTPFDFGATDNLDVTDFINDSTTHIQAAIDSGYKVFVPPSKLYITDRIIFKNPVHFEMSGSFLPMLDNSTSEFITDETDTTTIIYSDQNIDYFTIQSHNVKIYNGLIWTAESTNHTKRALCYDLNFRIWRSDVIGTIVYGNKDELFTNGIGTIALEVDGANLTTVGYLTEGVFDIRTYYCGTGAKVSTIDTSPAGAFVNNITFNLTGDGCKKFVDIASGSLFRFKGLVQDRAIMNQTEAESGDFFAFKFNCTDSVMDVFIFDTERSGGDAADHYRHEEFKYFIGGNDNIAEGLLLKFFNTGAIDTNNVESLNRNSIILDPLGYVLTNRSGMISQLNNAIAFAGNEGNVSYVGYKAPAASWFTNGLNEFPADDAVNNAVALAVSGDVTMASPALLLTSDPASARLPSHQIDNVADRDLHFAEIVISDLDTFQDFGASKLFELLLKIDGAAVDSIQCILHFNSGIERTEYTSTEGLPFPKNALFNMFDKLGSAFNNAQIETVIIRLIGQQEVDFTFIRDVALETQNAVNNPLVSIAGGQTIHGTLEVDYIVPILVTWAELLALQVAGDVFIGNKYIITDQSNEQILIKGVAPDNSAWFDRVDNAGVSTTYQVI